MTIDTTPTVNDQTATELRAAAARAGITGAGLARRIARPPLWVQRRLSGTATITLEDLVLLCGGLGVHVLDVVAQVLVDLDLVGDPAQPAEPAP